MESILKNNGFTAEEICIIRWQLQDYGGFYSSLMCAISRADVGNLQRLACGFPIEVRAFVKFEETDFYETIRTKLDQMEQFKGRF